MSSLMEEASVGYSEGYEEGYTEYSGEFEEEYTDATGYGGTGETGGGATEQGTEATYEEPFEDDSEAGEAAAGA